MEEGQKSYKNNNNNSDDNNNNNYHTNNNQEEDMTLHSKWTPNLKWGAEDSLGFEFSRGFLPISSIIMLGVKLSTVQAEYETSGFKFSFVAERVIFNSVLSALNQGGNIVLYNKKWL